MAFNVPTQEFHYSSAGPGSATDIATKTVWISHVYANNTTGGALTISLADKASTPVEILTAKSIPANDFIHLSFDPPLRANSGLNLNTPAGVDVKIQGFSNPNLV